MGGLLSLLLFAVLFYLMMRLGCGAHMIHGEGSGHDISHSNPGQTDPVCGMNVDPHQGYGKMYDGRLFRFCTRSCLDKFDNDPERYLHKGEHQT